MAKIITIWVTVFLLASLCSCTTQKEQVDHLVWEKLADDWGAPMEYSYKGSVPQLWIVTAPDIDSLLQDQLDPSYLELIRQTDFSVSFIAVIYQGQKGSTGYLIEVTDVQQKDNTITIYAQFHEPAPDSLTNPLITSPYYILKVEKTESIKGEFTFVLVADGVEVARQEHMIP